MKVKLTITREQGLIQFLLSDFAYKQALKSIKMEEKSLQKKLGVQFKQVNWLKTALTHKSYSQEQENLEKTPSDVANNERLEFLGDAVLDLVISDLLMQEFPEDQEGALSKKRALLVKEAALFEVGEELELSDYLLLGKGETSNGGAKKPRLIASAVEAVIGAIFLDAGYEKSREFILRHFKKRVKVLGSMSGLFIDFKSQLQMISQEQLKVVPNYSIVSEKGPDHDKSFIVKVEIQEKAFGEGEGKSKKQAEQSAAEEALKKLGVELEQK